MLGFLSVTFIFLTFFPSCLNSAASAIAANTFLRSLAGAIFPLFATYMVRTYHLKEHFFHGG
jgi:DHA1 family multidrug resistance protein-like MFS transporter